MRVVALLTIRNEEKYLARCLKHLYDQGVETCIIDNGSTDKSIEIAHSFRNRGVFQVEQIPYRGIFDLYKILVYKEQLALEIDADWFIHHDADEIREAPSQYENLREGIIDVDNKGFNAINFDEFVFIPTCEEENYEGQDFVQEMHFYYFFRFHERHRVNAWKKQEGRVGLADFGGHRVRFDGIKVFPENFILRHYIALSKDHLFAKYVSRVFSIEDIRDHRFHKNRVMINPGNIVLPDKSSMKKVVFGFWDRADPKTSHEFIKTTVQIQNATEKFAKERISLNIRERNSKRVVYDIPPMPFVVGVPRSGTTLLRLMLDTHPDLAIPPETHFIPKLFALQSSGRSLRKIFFTTVTGFFTWNDFHIPKDLFIKNLREIRNFTVSEGIRCFYYTYAKRLGKTRWGDKTPTYGPVIDQIQELLPEAHFIHLIRDGRDVTVSLRNLWFGPGEDLKQQTINWIWYIKQVRQKAQTVKHYIEIRFEDLIRDTKNTLSTICDFIKISYCDEMLKYYETAESRIQNLADRYNEVGSIKVEREKRINIFQSTFKPPDVSLIGKWKSIFSDDERLTFEKIAGDTLRDLDYEV